MANTSLYFGSAFGGSGGGGSVPSGWTWTATALTGPSGSSIETDSATFGGVTVTETGSSPVGLLNLTSLDDNTVYWLQMWNATYTSDPVDGLTGYQSDAGTVFLQVGPNATPSVLSMGTGFVGIRASDGAAVVPGGPGEGLMPGIVLDSGHAGGVLVGGDALDTPVAPTIANVGTPGAATVSYKIVAYTSQLFSHFANSAASAEATTNTAHATLDGTNFNRLTIAWPPGATYVDIFRTVGGPSQGLIGEITSGTTFDDTGIAGDSSTPPDAATAPWNGLAWLSKGAESDGPFTGTNLFLLDGGAVKGDTTTAHTYKFQVYDVNGTAYRDWMTATNGDAPSVVFTPPTTGTLTMQATTYKSSDGSSGATAGPFTVITGITVKNGLVTVLTGS